MEDTRKSADRVTRRRLCKGCRHSYVTVELLSEAGLQVRKLDGSVVDFSRNSIRRAIRKAAVEPFDPERLDALVESVVQEIYRRGTPVVSSQAVGESLLVHLRSVHEASHIRFALVHCGRRDRADTRPGWADVSEVLRWLHDEYPELQYYNPPARLRTVIKRSGDRQDFSRKKLEQSIGYSSKGRGSREDVYQLAQLVASDVEAALADQPMVTSGQISAEILRSLRERDDVAYLRFASTAKLFASPQDYEAEAVGLQHSTRQTRQRPS